jgi:hypothetical protein
MRYKKQIPFIAVAGITLSPTIVIAYIMATYRKTTEEAIAHVQAHRYCLSVKPVSVRPPCSLL